MNALFHKLTKLLVSRPCPVTPNSRILPFAGVPAPKEARVSRMDGLRAEVMSCANEETVVLPRPLLGGPSRRRHRFGRTSKPTGGGYTGPPRARCALYDGR